ncbi:MAG: aminopeptidase [Bdellovibrionales bacterium]|nr:aminopeptidase [Bdellovibrionales bacterium]
MGYYMHSAYHQSKLANSRRPIPEVLKTDKLTAEQKKKLELVEEVKTFGETQLGLAKSKNYTSFVQLEEPYVTYIVQAAKVYELKPYLWHFPFVGDVPYKGYFRKALAEEEAAAFDKEKYDTYVRGVSAYSTLGWFQDSVLSSMLRYTDIDLVETILHETIHTTLYIKSAADFNERLATFMGHEGMKLFYLQKEGLSSPHLKEAENDSADQKLFSAFITKELDDLKKWYEMNAGQVGREKKAARLKEIQDRFSKDLKPNLKGRNYADFDKRELNNALLLAYKTYEFSLADFEKVYEHFGRDFRKTLEWMKGLEKEKNPEQALKDFAAQVSSPSPAPQTR